MHELNVVIIVHNISSTADYPPEDALLIGTVFTHYQMEKGKVEGESGSASQQMP